MDSTVASPLLRKSDSSSVRSGFCKLYTFLNVLIFQDVVIFTFVEDMKFFSKLLVSVENKCELTVRDEHLIFQQKNFCGQKLSDLEILLHEILSLILFSLLGCQCML